MTAFTPSDIPQEINTVENLAIWVGLVLQKINPDQTALEGTGPAQKVAQLGLYQVEQTNQTRVIIRHSIEIEEDFTYDGGKLWQQAVPFSTNPIPFVFVNNQLN
ncbi:glucose-6-phosphate dehydrogenase [Plectonema cf. radiosum LEGE 06105]|uniref:Glucose-6-phosphate dehydrogenase n=1 Tax=Plectonema cf. radiosum LEGE 06105 TaxID=945769 RepID=A0A8J7F1T3_9CYAN|nr:glucose-6-phosphate dehydrogenase [Plectonema radiosum]MBE9214566.1 glucose-6-phosphate dehydrogenase [Plectonema cf. radiosum LEGE 06105]